MRFDIITLFPEMCQNILDSSLLKKFQERNVLEVFLHNPRDFAKDNHKSVDDTPYGGGVGMVLRVDIFDETIQKVKNMIKEKGLSKNRVILLTPQGQKFNQITAREYGDKYDQITLICGHYEGFDERIRSLIDEELSLGDFVLTGGELPAMIIVDAVTRLLPGALTENSVSEESHSFTDEDGNTLLEYPQYTRPASYKGMNVPEILMSGHHAEIAKWRMKMAKEKTNDRQTI